MVDGDRERRTGDELVEGQEGSEDGRGRRLVEGEEGVSEGGSAALAGDKPYASGQSGLLTDPEAANMMKCWG